MKVFKKCDAQRIVLAIRDRWESLQWRILFSANNKWP
jgi:hypothetical protein